MRASCQSLHIGLGTHKNRMSTPNFVCACMILTQKFGCQQAPTTITWLVNELTTSWNDRLNGRNYGLEFFHELFKLVLRLIKVALNILGDLNSRIILDCCDLRRCQGNCVDFFN